MRFLTLVAAFLVVAHAAIVPRIAAEELAAQRVRRNQGVDGIINPLQPLQAAGGQLFNGRENHLARGARVRMWYCRGGLFQNGALGDETNLGKPQKDEAKDGCGVFLRLELRIGA